MYVTHIKNRIRVGQYLGLAIITFVELSKGDFFWQNTILDEQQQYHPSKHGILM